MRHGCPGCSRRSYLGQTQRDTSRLDSTRASPTPRRPSPVSAGVFLLDSRVLLCRPLRLRQSESHHDSTIPLACWDVRPSVVVQPVILGVVQRSAGTVQRSARIPSEGPTRAPCPLPESRENAPPDATPTVEGDTRGLRQ